MIRGDLIHDLSFSVVKAVTTDLDPIPQEDWDFSHDKVDNCVVRTLKGVRDVRPMDSECSVYCFPQTWGSTALGFGGIGGAAMTTAYTVVVIGPQQDACVYFNGRLAYHVKVPNDTFAFDLGRHLMRSVREATGVYEAVVSTNVERIPPT